MGLLLRRAKEAREKKGGQMAKGRLRGTNLVHDLFTLVPFRVFPTYITSISHSLHIYYPPFLSPASTSLPFFSLLSSSLVYGQIHYTLPSIALSFSSLPPPSSCPPHSLYLTSTFKLARNLNQRTL